MCVTPDIWSVRLSCPEIHQIWCECRSFGRPSLRLVISPHKTGNLPLWEQVRKGINRAPPTTIVFTDWFTSSLWFSLLGLQWASCEPSVLPGTGTYGYMAGMAPAPRLIMSNMYARPHNPQRSNQEHKCILKCSNESDEDLLQERRLIYTHNLNWELKWIIGTQYRFQR